MSSIKTLTIKSKKFEMCNIIKDKYHIHHSGDFLHYAVFIPNSKDPDWREKDCHWYE
jgi:hypothetical protein